MLQSWLRPALTVVGPNADHRRLVTELERIEGVLSSASLECQAIDFALENFAVSKGRHANAREAAKVAEFALFSLRSEVLRHLGDVPILVKTLRGFQFGV